MPRPLVFLSFAIVFALPACGAETPPPAPPPVPAAPAISPAPSATVIAPAASASAVAQAPADPPKPVMLLKYSGLSTPESVLYDGEEDRYLVSNVNGKPSDKDNNGFISVLSPSGTVSNLKWIEGGKNKVRLNAPKGLGITGGVLYVADIDTVRTFDAKSGAPKADIPIAGATFLNDVCVGADGRVYVSDTGIKFGANGPESTKTDAVYVIEKGKAKAIAKGSELGGPNGVVLTDKGLVVVTFGSGEVYRLDEKGKKQDVSKPPAGMLDGVVALGDSLLVTSWQASAIYRGKLGGPFEVALADQKSPADIGYDTKRGRVLVPHFTEDVVDVYELR